MADCCIPSGYGDFFDRKQAERDLRRYDRKGLDKMARSLVDYLSRRGVSDRSVLEAGGGIGAIQVELLRSGAGASTNVELSPGYEATARRLLEREGFVDSTQRRIGDFTELSSDLRADDVVLNRVICCYPYPDRLMTAALRSSRRFVAATFPRDRLAARVALWFGNSYCRIRGFDFRSFVHPTDSLLAAAKSEGFQVVFEDRDFIWNAVVWERSETTPE